MPRNPEPTQTKKAKGVDKKNPGRINESEPKAGDIGFAPKWFCDQKIIIWNDALKDTATGVMQSSDRFLLTEFCELVFLARHKRDNFTSAARKDFISIASRFGFSPSDRQKIVAEKPKDDNNFDFLDDDKPH